MKKTIDLFLPEDFPRDQAIQHCVALRESGFNALPYSNGLYSLLFQYEESAEEMLLAVLGGHTLDEITPTIQEVYKRTEGKLPLYVLTDEDPIYLPEMKGVAGYDYLDLAPEELVEGVKEALGYLAEDAGNIEPAPAVEPEPETPAGDAPHVLIYVADGDTDSIEDYLQKMGWEYEVFQDYTKWVIRLGSICDPDLVIVAASNSMVGAKVTADLLKGRYMYSKYAHKFFLAYSEDPLVKKSSGETVPYTSTKLFEGIFNQYLAGHSPVVPRLNLLLELKKALGRREAVLEEKKRQEEEEARRKEEEAQEQCKARVAIRVLVYTEDWTMYANKKMVATVARYGCTAEGSNSYNDVAARLQSSPPIDILIVHAHTAETAQQAVEWVLRIPIAPGRSRPKLLAFYEDFASGFKHEKTQKYQAFRARGICELFYCGMEGLMGVKAAVMADKLLKEAGT